MDRCLGHAKLGGRLAKGQTLIAHRRDRTSDLFSRWPLVLVPQASQPGQHADAAYGTRLVRAIRSSDSPRATRAFVMATIARSSRESGALTQECDFCKGFSFSRGSS